MRVRRSTSTTQPAVSFSLNSEGAVKFSRATTANVGRYLAIVLDNQVVSAPRIDGPIEREGRIYGHLHAAGSQ